MPSEANTTLNTTLNTHALTFRSATTFDAAIKAMEHANAAVRWTFRTLMTYQAHTRWKPSFPAPVLLENSPPRNTSHAPRTSVIVVSGLFGL